MRNAPLQLKQLVPPIVAHAMWHLLWTPKVYASYHDAAIACADNGYERAELLDIVYEKTRRYRDRLLTEKPVKVEPASVRTHLALNLALKGSSLSVIDFGGACGVHYFTVKSLLDDRAQLLWCVVETAAMVKRARELENSELKFVDSLPAAISFVGMPDLLFSSAALQYLPNPHETVEQLTMCGARNIFLTSLGLTSAASDIVCVQKSPFAANGPGPLPADMRDGVAKYPVTFARKDRVEEVLSRRYDLRARFEEDRGAYELAGESVGMYGYFCDLRKQMASASDCT
jgi:putative methyltransferase (TIGR04325 family)